MENHHPPKDIFTILAPLLAAYCTHLYAHGNPPQLFVVVTKVILTLVDMAGTPRALLVTAARVQAV